MVRMNSAGSATIRAKFNRAYLLMLSGGLFVVGSIFIYITPVDRLPFSIVLPLGPAGLDISPWLVGTIGFYMMAFGQGIRAEAHGDRLQAEFDERHRQGSLEDPDFVRRIEALKDDIIRDAVRRSFRYRMRVAWMCLVLAICLFFIAAWRDAIMETSEPALVALGLGGFIVYRFIRTIADKPLSADKVRRSLGR